jgi:hypothetical protein
MPNESAARNQTTHTASLVAAAVVLLVLLLAVYLASYYAMLEEMNVGARYRVNSPVVAIFYWPANQFDRVLRPEFWGE